MSGIKSSYEHYWIDVSDLKEITIKELCNRYGRGEMSKQIRYAITQILGSSVSGFAPKYQHVSNAVEALSLALIGEDGIPNGSIPDENDVRAIANVKEYGTIDIYRTCAIFGLDDHSGRLHHAIKKLLCTGNRGVKDNDLDIKEACITLDLWLKDNEPDPDEDTNRFPNINIR